ncbi:gluconate kinase, SKI family [Cohaesibacter sp. ES.047]|uniref:gluconokinase n=1 Tax=Cohaesibacter sp. ES.047 TaxID=1798205 RepID=UPI000BBF6F5B|nr:gluconokinase [Cohaesibacter sp. ES.047]SNY89959.1 gluconate kinase, SKI family [Cohaesibacter sp. ES.047]
MIIIVMGISGSGKSTLGKLLAERFGFAFEEGDAFHSKANVEKMAAGIPLTDEDRKPWLETLTREIAKWSQKGEARVLSCSALRKSYRDQFRTAARDLRFVFLDGAVELVRDRMAHRERHFMPVDLIESQIATLEVPDGEEDVIRLDIDKSPQELVDHIAAILEPIL